MNKQIINSVLHYTYNPNSEYAGLDKSIEKYVKEKNINIERKKLIPKYKQALLDAITNCLETIDTEVTQVIPLSSGLDSRAILAGLLNSEAINNDDIVTVSFGTPGSFDYELSQQVARKANVKNISIDLTGEDINWSMDKLQKHVKRYDHPNRFFEGYANSLVLNRIPDDSVIWSGFMGDPPAGGHINDMNQYTWKRAKKYFAEYNTIEEQWTHEDYEPTSVLPEEPYLSNKELSFRDQLDFAHSQACFIRPIVIQQEDKYATPFMKSEWLEFTLNLNRKYRKDRSLFIQMVCECFPDLFSIPTDATRGLPPGASHFHQQLRRILIALKRKGFKIFGCEYTSPHTNYIDFDKHFRANSQLRDVADRLIKSLAERGVIYWFDPQQIWQRHLDGERLGREVRVLCSLELFLRK